MNQGLALLDEALDLARLEKTALEDGAYEEAIELAEKRSRITGMAWECEDMSHKESYRTRLMELSKLQNQLVQMATHTRDMIRNSLCRSRQEKKRIKGYQLSVGQALQ